VSVLRSLPFKAQIFIWSISICGIATVILALLRDSSKILTKEFFILLVCAILVTPIRISLLNLFTNNKNKNDVNNSVLELTFIFASIAFLNQGVTSAILIYGFSTFIAGINKKNKWFQILFNTNIVFFLTGISSYVFLLFNSGDNTLHIPNSAIALFVMSTTAFLVNTFGVATIIALCTSQNIYQVWKRDMSGTGISFFVSMSIAATATYVAGTKLIPVLLLSTPVVWMIYHFYKIQEARAKEQEVHAQEIAAKQQELSNVYLKTIKSLALAIDAKDQYTHQHIIRVQRYSVAIAKQMDFDEEQVQLVETSALLHDVGKIGVPEYILLKPGRLTDDEFAKVKQHPEIGAAILEPVDFPREIIDGVKYHHEKWDGTGYPDGLKGEEIPLFGRILAVADVYDALTSNRSYRKAWTHEKAKALIEDSKDKHFDGKIAETFLQVIDGVVLEMEKEGTGPLVPILDNAPATTPTIVRDLQRASSELWALYEVAQAISPHLDLEETLLLLSRKMENIITGTTSLFLLWEGDDKKQLVVKSASGLNAGLLKQAITPLQNSISIRTARTSVIYQGAFDIDDLVLMPNASEAWVELRSVLILPIVHEAETLGTVNFYHTEANAFQDSDISLLTMLVSKIGQALYNGIVHERLHHSTESSVDTLTGLPNGKQLITHLHTRCQETAKPFTLLCVDIDNFKAINDVFGHSAGDQMLQKTSVLLQTILNDKGQVVRSGGNEFLLFLEIDSPEEVGEFVGKLQRTIARFDTGLTHPDMGTLRLPVSMGIAHFPDDGTIPNALRSCASTRMNQQKTKNKVMQLRTPQTTVPMLPSFDELRTVAQE
jgi:diguanylate cyclase (GGDEF)-like protein/putative nucleotidyltransferase with HDIG domain